MSRREQERRIAALLANMQAKAQPFADCSPGAVAKRKARARADFNYFCRTYLPHYFETKLSSFHREIQELCDIKGVPVACAAPRGHGKTTTMKAKCLRSVLFEATKYLVYSMDTEDQAVQVTGDIRLELAENPRVKADFGSLVNNALSPRGDGHWVTTTGIMVLARGKGQGVRGISNGPHRPDLWILDDMENDEEVLNPERVEKTKRYLQRKVIPAMKRGLDWSIFWVGTVLAKGSALAQALDPKNEFGSAFITRLYRAIKEDDTPLCPEMFTLDDLEKIKGLIGTLAFAAEYMNDPIDPDGAFREEWLTTYNPELVADELARGVTTLAIDASLDDKKQHDYKAVVVVTRAPSGVVYVRDAWIRKASIDAMLEAAFSLFVSYSPIVMGVEAVGFQKLLMREFERLSREKHQRMPTRAVKQRESKTLRILRLSPAHERGMVRYPEGFPGDLRILKAQLIAFPSRGAHDDGPDALEMADRLAQAGAQAGGFIGVRSARASRPPKGSSRGNPQGRKFGLRSLVQAAMRHYGEGQ